MEPKIHKWQFLAEYSLKQISLYQAMDKIRARYGDRSVFRAIGMDARTIGRSNPLGPNRH